MKNWISRFDYKFFTLTVDMLWFVFLMATAAVAEWPPKDCDRKTRRLVSSMMFTSKDSKNVDTMCRLSEEYEGNVFIEFERRLVKERLRRPAESHLTFHLI